MADFCGKCGARLDPATGLCPECSARQPEPEPAPAPGPQPGGKRPKKEKRKPEKADRPEKGRVKRVFTRVLIALLVISVVSGSCACALVVLDAKGNPFVQNLLVRLGLREAPGGETDETRFSELPGRFTDRKIQSAEDAILAAQEAAPQLGLTNAFDELTPIGESTVDGLTYYRLQQCYNGVPVYGKTVTVIADENGAAAGISSNCADIAAGVSAPRIDMAAISAAVETYVVNSGFRNVSELSVKEVSAQDAFLYTAQDGETVLACNVYASFSYEYGKTTVPYLYDLTNNRVIFQVSVLNSEQAVCYGPTAGDGSFPGLLLDSTYYMKDTDRNIFIFNAGDQTFWDPDGGLAQDVPQMVTSPDAYFGNDSADEGTYQRGFRLLKALTSAYDYYAIRFGDPGIGTVVGVYDDHVGRYNGDNAGGGIVAVSSIISGSLPDFTDPNRNNQYADATGMITFGTTYSADVNNHLDTLFHEYTHFISRKNVDWVSKGQWPEEDQPGAINEGYSDIFGEIISAYYNNGSTDWVHGERNIGNPKANKYPASVKDVKCKLFNSQNQQYGISITGGYTDYSHGASTVVSHAAYLMANGDGSGSALSMQTLAKLWYHTMLSLPADCTFSVLRQCMEATADTIGCSSQEKERVAYAFDQVGIADPDDGEKIDLESSVRVFDKNGEPYDDYTITVDGQEFNGWFKWGWIKKDYHNEITVTSANAQRLDLPKGDYTITVTDRFSGARSEEKKVKARKDQDQKRVDFATSFGCDYSVKTPVYLTVKDVNGAIYDHYIVTVTGVTENGTDYTNSMSVTQAEAVDLGLSAGKYRIVLTDDLDQTKRKTVMLRALADAVTDGVTIKTSFGRPFGEFSPEDIPNGAKEFNGHWYYVYDMPAIASWDAAKEFCRSKNGYLATLTSAEENAFVRGLVTDSGFENAYFGLVAAGNDDWKWVTGEALDYTNWAPGEPNSRNENYGMFFRNAEGRWNDGDFGSLTDDTRTFICEWGTFSVEDGDEPETPVVRTTSDERDIVLVLDVSGSMSGNKLEETKKASVNFINTVLEEDASIAIVIYDDYARIVSDFSTNAASLVSVAEGIGSGGTTNIEDGLKKAMNLLGYSNAEKRIIVLMSDGAPNEGKVGDELIAYAQQIKDEGVYLYTLGFFGDYSGKSAEQTLMEKMASDGCHYEVSDADNLRFFFGDIADVINGRQYIYIRIACPVDVSVTYGGETLNSAEDSLSTRTSFGTLSFEENEKQNADADDRVKVLRLKADDRYDVQIVGTGTGRMNYTIGFMDENGEYSDFRRFTNVRINRYTVIDTVAENTRHTVLNVDEDGDGKYDLKYQAGENERGEIVDHSYVVWLVLAAVLAIAVAILLPVLKRRRKHGKKRAA